MKASWEIPKINQNYGFGVYGPKEVELERQYVMNGGENYDDMIFLAFLNKMVLAEQPWKKCGPGELEKVKSKFQQSNDGYGVYLFHNETEKTLLVELEVVKALNVSFVKPVIDENKVVNLSVGPGQVNMVLWEVTDQVSKLGFKIRYIVT